MILPDKTNSAVTTQQFLDDLHGPNAEIYFNVGDITWKKKPQTYSQAESKLKWLNTKKREDICFIPNSGGTASSQINRINAAFLDWDAGKNKNGDYLSLEHVAKRKAEFLDKLKKSPLEPTYIIETRNGYQVYWLLHPGATKEQFTDAQKRIAYYFKGDPRIYTPAHVMRLPGYLWIKPHKNCAPYFVYIFTHNHLRYSICSILKAFPPVSDDQYQSYKNSEKQSPVPENRVRKSAHNNNVVIIKDITLANYVGTFPSTTSSTTPADKTSVLHQLKQKNLAAYLNLSYKGSFSKNRAVSFRCLFHDDKKASATIFINENNHYIYHCHSSNCGFSGSIIDVVMKQDGLDICEAVGKLIYHYGLGPNEKWIKEQKMVLRINVRIIENIQEQRDKYPDLCRTIGRIKNDLITKLRFAEENVALRTGNNENIIICSLRKFHQLVYPMADERELGRQNERVDRYCLLGLMRKLHDCEINSSLRAGAYETRRQMAGSFSKKRGKEQNICRTQFYTIPEYSVEVLSRANDIAKQLKEHGIRMNSISRDLVLQIFGEEKALEIYPQVQREDISSKGKVLTDRIEELLLDRVESKGYARVGQIVEQMHTFDEWRTLTDRRVKRYLPGLFKKHNLIEITANKELKQQLGIETVGYPKVVVRRISATSTFHF